MRGRSVHRVGGLQRRPEREGGSAEVAGTRLPPGRILLHRPKDEVRDEGWHVLRERRWDRGRVRHRYAHRGVGLERPLPAEALVGDDTEGVDVAGGGRRASRRLLG